ncbi:MAG: MmcQ/YjbR family DNA-binding protein [Flavobacteriaceae bacterium]|nr:MmcQ/YjbR family DNA-binding protein [Flavobacteriaceae bacterium]
MKNIEVFREYCISKPHVTESFPFDNSTLVFKVCNKMFALTNLDKHPFSANLKCDPELAVELRETYPDIIPGWHMNKKHWNTLVLDAELPEEFIKIQLDNSYDLVVASLTKKLRKEYGLD